MEPHVTADKKQVEGHDLLAVASRNRHCIGGVTEISPSVYLNDDEIDL